MKILDLNESCYAELVMSFELNHLQGYWDGYLAFPVTFVGSSLLQLEHLTSIFDQYLAVRILFNVDLSQTLFQLVWERFKYSYPSHLEMAFLSHFRWLLPWWGFEYQPHITSCLGLGWCLDHCFKLLKLLSTASALPLSCASFEDWTYFKRSKDLESLVFEKPNACCRSSDGSSLCRA